MIKKSVFCLWSLFLCLSLVMPVQGFTALGEMFFLPPHANWQKLKTSHFDILFPNDYETEARQTAAYLEQAHATLAPYYGYEPNHHTTVILIDNEDSANGVASAVGLQGLILFMARPDPYQAIGEYEHWLKGLVMHEYAHYLTLEQTNGVFSFLRLLFGHSLFPNHFWPTWLAEGLAVHAESTFTEAGRGYGTYYATITRDAVHRRKLGSTDFLAYSKLMGPVPDFPFGDSHYYAGFGVVDEMLTRYGKDAPGRYATRSSFRVPYFLDGGVTALDGERTGLGFADLWQSWISRQRARLEPELDWLAKNGTPDPEFLTEEGIATKGARLSPDGTRAAYVLQSGHERPGLAVVDVATKKSRKLDEAVAGAGLAWSSDGKTVYYGKSDYVGPFAFYSDLYSYDVDGGCSARRLTHNERAKDPDACGDKLVYVSQRGRHSEIRSFDLKTKTVVSLYRAPENHHVATPRCSSDGKTVFFSEHGTVPLDFMRAVSIDGGDSRRLFGGPGSGFAALFAQPLSNGDLLFTRAKGGYYDLARWNSSTKQITTLARSTGGYWLPSIARAEDKVAVTYLSSTGLRAGLLELKPRTGADATTYNDTVSAVAKPLNVDQAPSSKLGPEKIAAAPVPQINATKKGYNLLTSLAPRIWAPHLLFSNIGGQYGIALTGWDDLDQFQYLFNAYYDSYHLDRMAGSLSTSHRISTFKLGLFAASGEDATYSLGNGRLAVDEERTVGVVLSRPIPSTWWVFTPAAVAQWSRTWRHFDNRDELLRPEMAVGANLSFDSRAQYQHSIAPEKGTRALLQGRRLFADDRRAWKSMFSLEQVVPVVPRHGALSLTGHAAWAPSPKREINESEIKIGGRGEQSDLNPPLRGYRLGTFSAKRAAVAQAEYRVPVFEIFEGLGNWPFFLRNFGLFGFYDGAKFQERSGRTSEWISGAGGGLLVNTTIGYQLPLQLRLEFAHGFKKSRGGEDLVSLSVGL